MRRGIVPKGSEAIAPSISSDAEQSAKRLKLARLLNPGILRSSIPPSNTGNSPVSTPPEHSSVRSSVPPLLWVGPPLEVDVDQLREMIKRSSVCTFDWIRRQVEGAHGKPYSERPSVRPVKLKGGDYEELYCRLSDGTLFRVKKG